MVMGAARQLRAMGKPKRTAARPATLRGKTMNTGIVSDFDAKGGFGLIDSDDGQVVLFNSETLDVADLQTLRIGSRVQFIEQPDPHGARAECIRLCQ
jgi:cold shock CspA family protein